MTTEKEDRSDVEKTRLDASEQRGPVTRERGPYRRSQLARAVDSRLASCIDQNTSCFKQLLS